MEQIGGFESGPLPASWQQDVSTIAPVLEKLTSRRSPLESVRIVMTTLLDQIALARKPQSGLAAALARGMVAREELKHVEGGSFSAEEARVALGGLSKEAVLKRYRKGQLLGWREARQNAVRFPVWQFVEGRTLQGLEKVLAELPLAKAVDEWARLKFFLGPRGDLGGQRPLDLLRRGDVDAVVRAARVFAER